MTNNASDGNKTKCVFVPKWKCPIEAPEIPLEVCKLCLEARKLQLKQVKINRQVETVELSAATSLTEIEPEVPQISP
jgi:hypothetical protein